MWPSECCGPRKPLTAVLILDGSLFPEHLQGAKGQGSVGGGDTGHGSGQWLGRALLRTSVLVLPRRL